MLLIKSRFTTGAILIIYKLERDGLAGYLCGRYTSILMKISINL